MTKKEYEFIKDQSSNKYSPIAESYAKLIRNIRELKSTRDSIINRHFYELYHYNIDELEDRDVRIKRLIGKSTSYPNSFLASSLGFNRTTWVKKYEEILGKFDLGKKPKYLTMRNMMLFEKLKLLVIKYFNSKKKDKKLMF
ncbi:hypothetical protein NCER_101468 [Vairimorpha ceranae BRL01]|uniref:Uncharacterized protein n=2 Tax=Vairimorpha ceranae TaxID=40302 RepID=C4VA34_VAIC1|nr:hypothetical protein AAJ76_500095995 [Vairimorpha ceranae]EEQ81923.1 hypothetical protein NCER_101468 [Vairimorpha ceranae BRL01]KAF5141009.1 hypothetical protein G9O61_00g008530 [Vairimorpha ceranae]KAF5141515.1 hypothetical protein G9O61_00g003790 [Vairimorpha ceranae]KKO76263.1 hypothetical protein AAJ76_500095995 [Vairimorpha ceranae]